MWLIVMLVAAVSAASGYVLLGQGTAREGAFAQGFAAGALLAMIGDTLLPEAYEVERVQTGSLVAIGLQSRSCFRRFRRADREGWVPASNTQPRLDGNTTTAR
jgi:hypothetical protein